MSTRVAEREAKVPHKVGPTQKGEPPTRNEETPPASAIPPVTQNDKLRPSLRVTALLLLLTVLLVWFCRLTGTTPEMLVQYINTIDPVAVLKFFWHLLLVILSLTVPLVLFILLIREAGEISQVLGEHFSLAELFRDITGVLGLAGTLLGGIGRSVLDPGSDVEPEEPEAPAPIEEKIYYDNDPLLPDELQQDVRAAMEQPKEKNM